MATDKLQYNDRNRRAIQALEKELAGITQQHEQLLQQNAHLRLRNDVVADMVQCTGVVESLVQEAEVIKSNASSLLNDRTFFMQHMAMFGSYVKKLGCLLAEAEQQPFDPSKQAVLAAGVKSLLEMSVILPSSWDEDMRVFMQTAHLKQGYELLQVSEGEHWRNVLDAMQLTPDQRARALIAKDVFHNCITRALLKTRSPQSKSLLDPTTPRDPPSAPHPTASTQLPHPSAPRCTAPHSTAAATTTRAPSVPPASRNQHVGDTVLQILMDLQVSHPPAPTATPPGPASAPPTSPPTSQPPQLAAKGTTPPPSGSIAAANNNRVFNFNAKPARPVARAAATSESNSTTSTAGTPSPLLQLMQGLRAGGGDSSLQQLIQGFMAGGGSLPVQQLVQGLGTGRDGSSLQQLLQGFMAGGGGSAPLQQLMQGLGAGSEDPTLQQLIQGLIGGGGNSSSAGASVPPGVSEQAASRGLPLHQMLQNLAGTNPPPSIAANGAPGMSEHAPSGGSLPLQRAPQGLAGTNLPSRRAAGVRRGMSDPASSGGSLPPLQQKQGLAGTALPSRRAAGAPAPGVSEQVASSGSLPLQQLMQTLAGTDPSSRAAGMLPGVSEFVIDGGGLPLSKLEQYIDLLAHWYQILDVYFQTKLLTPDQAARSYLAAFPFWPLTAAVVTMIPDEEGPGAGQR